MLFLDAILLLMAGYDTTSKTLCSALLMLKRHPEVEEKLKAEIHGRFSDEIKSGKTLSELLNAESLDELTYLNMFVKEVMRYKPAASRSLGYQTKEQITLSDGLVMPAGQTLIFNLGGLLFHPDQWKDPHTFDPERFNTEDPDSHKTPSGERRH